MAWQPFKRFRKNKEEKENQNKPGSDFTSDVNTNYAFHNDLDTDDDFDPDVSWSAFISDTFRDVIDFLYYSVDSLTGWSSWQFSFGSEEHLTPSEKEAKRRRIHKERLEKTLEISI